MSTPVSTSLYIGGKERQAAEKMAIADPAKPGVVVGHCAAATTKDVGDAVAAAKAAYPTWTALPPQQRAEKMLAALKGIAENRDEDAAILSQENGKIRFEAWIDSLVLELRWKLALGHADEINAAKVLPPIHGAIPVETTVAYQSLGVVTIIVPFNWPVAILGAALPHALLAGNTVIVKPPLTAPLATARIVQRIAEQLPPGVLNVVTGADANMSALIRNPDVAKVCFTGSVGGGKKMMEMASHSLTRVTLELGGNDAAIMLKDAIIDDTHLDRLFAAIYDTTGQICMNAKRLFVHTSHVDEVINGLSARLEKVKIGYGLDKDTTMGPLHSPAQKAFVESLITEAKDAGSIGNRRHLYQAIPDPGRVGKIERLLMSRFGPSDQWLAALSSLVTVRILISYSDHEVAPVSSLVTAPRLRPVFANNRGSGRATPARGPRAARRRSTRGFRAFEAIVAGSIACSPPDTRARNSISAGAARGGHGQITSGSTGIDVVGS